MDSMNPISPWPPDGAFCRLKRRDVFPEESDELDPFSGRRTARSKCIYHFDGG